MARHGHTQEHVPHRRWSALWRKRCSCGNASPCVVRATLERGRYFVRDVAPGWSIAPTVTARAVARPTVPAVKNVPVSRRPDRPLLTPGQRSRSAPAGAAEDAERLYDEGLRAAREWQRDERRRWARGRPPEDRR
jgi:hypothetical protein